MTHFIDGKRERRKYPPNPQFTKVGEDQRRVAAWIRECQEKRWISGK